VTALLQVLEPLSTAAKEVGVPRTEHIVGQRLERSPGGEADQHQRVIREGPLGDRVAVLGLESPDAAGLPG